MELYKVWQKKGLFSTYLKLEKKQKTEGKGVRKRDFPAHFPPVFLFCSFSQVLNFLGCPLEQPSMAQCSTGAEPGNLGVPAVLLLLIDIPFQLFHSLLAF